MRRVSPIVFRPAAVLAWSTTLALVADASAQQSRAPQEFSLEEFEPAVRDQISRAYEQVEKHPADAARTGKLGMLFQAYGKYDLAEQYYERARALDPWSFRWTYYLGAVTGMLGKNPQAVALIRAALELDPAYVPGRVRLAQLLFDGGDPEQSEREYRSVVTRQPRVASAHFGLGKVLAARGDWTSAIECYRRACELAEDYAAAHYALALAYRSTGETAKAQAHIEEYRRFKGAKQPSEDPLMDEVQRLYAGGMTHFAAGSTLAREGRLKQAAAEFEAALRVNPRLVMAHIDLIAMYGQLGLTDKAEQHFRAAVDLDPGWVEAYHNWGMVLVQRGNKTEAANAFSKAIEVNPNHADSHFQLGVLLEELGQAAPAAEHFERALEINSNHRQAHYYLARNRLRAGRADEAIRHLLETIKVDDDWTAFCMRGLALAYEAAGQRDQAIRYIEEARQRAATRRMHELVSQLDQDAGRLREWSARN